MRRSAILAAVLVATVLAPSHLAAQSPRDLIAAMLDAAATMKQADGFRPDGEAVPRDIVVGALPAGGAVVLELRLEGGTTYFIGGVCDEDCTDMDMWLIDPEDGATLAEDASDDDVPILEFVAPRTGTYFLSLMMYDCAEEYCLFGYQVLKK
ncbi:MAG: PPC domain-containing protein [Gemmatimonadota bacterium]